MTPDNRLNVVQNRNALFLLSTLKEQTHFLGQYFFQYLTFTLGDVDRKISVIIGTPAAFL